MHKMQSVKSMFGAMAVALIAAIAVVATPVAAAVSKNAGFSVQQIEPPAATVKIAAKKKKKKKKRTRYPAGKGS